MLAVDTNVIVRYLTNDDPQQSPRARQLIDTADVWVPTTVLLETEWVLRSIYRHGAAEIAAALRGFASLARVTLENAALVSQALDWLEGGIDFADALHLAAARDCEAFVTFDAAFVRAATRSGMAKLRTP